MIGARSIRIFPNLFLFTWVGQACAYLWIGVALGRCRFVSPRPMGEPNRRPAKTAEENEGKRREQPRSDSGEGQAESAGTLNQERRGLVHRAAASRLCCQPPHGVMAGLAAAIAAQHNRHAFSHWATEVGGTMRGSNTPDSNDLQIALRPIPATNCTAVVTLRLPLKRRAR
jgi:hypothetical protein